MREHHAPPASAARHYARRLYRLPLSHYVLDRPGAAHRRQGGLGASGGFPESAGGPEGRSAGPSARQSRRIRRKTADSRDFRAGAGKAVCPGPGGQRRGRHGHAGRHPGQSDRGRAPRARRILRRFRHLRLLRLADPLHVRPERPGKARFPDCHGHHGAGRHPLARRRNRPPAPGEPALKGALAPCDVRANTAESLTNGAPAPISHCSMSSSPSPSETWHGTTILTVRKAGKVVVAGDGQVSLGQTIIKGTARKVRRVGSGKVIAGFAGSTADAFTLFERLETKLERFPDQLKRACVELAKDWRTDRYLRRLEAMMIVADPDESLVLTGTGDVLEPDDAVMGIGSGGSFALAAARALLDTDLDAEAIARKAMSIAAKICVYTNDEVTVETLDATK